ncbi:MAG: acetyl-Coa acetyltransferase, acetyl-CoA C-acetyltransferase [Deltaproteobacteria bacterium CSP1-8]|nr:MAG: acetyl-Coa acetyltransferase, acetyl-CoA C-acetyltransferase [Deltaproteobacteria bacterium CSP1-8]
MKEVVITGAARTAAGSFLGSLADIPAPKLGAVAIAEAVSRGGIKKEEVDQVIMGNVLPAGVGQAPARQAGIFAGIPVSAGAMTINKMCGSGLKAVMLAAQAVATDEFEVVVAGGMESMSQAPYILMRGRTGYRLGNDTIYDHMMIDGLIDAYNGIHMGNCAEMLSREHCITREDQDEFAANSYRRALAAIRDGKFEKEVVGVEIPQKKGPPVVFRVDEEPGRGNIDKFPSLKPVFEKEGTVTAGNASTINDGAAAVVVMSAEAAGRRGIKPIARILGYTTASLEPVWFTVAPIDAIRKLLRKTGVEKDQVGLYEINEAFSSVAIAAIRGLQLDPERVNVHGGAVALGHPVGASGAKILTTLLYAMVDRGERYGIASLCIGGGEAVAMLVERL